jgi:hypothetical protein
VHVVASSNEVAQSVLRVKFMQAIGAALLHHYTHAKRRVYVVFSERICLNAVVAVGCLGFKIVACSSTVFCVDFDRQAVEQSSKPGKLLFNKRTAKAFQFQTVWDADTQQFRSSYFNTLRYRFQWSKPRATLFLAEVSALKQRGGFETYSLLLESCRSLQVFATVNTQQHKKQEKQENNKRNKRKLRFVKERWSELMQTAPDVKVYAELKDKTCFFGVAGDLQERHLWQKANKQESWVNKITCLYFTTPSEVDTLIRNLNKVSKLAGISLDVAHMQTLPKQALCNLSQQWSAKYARHLHALVSGPTGQRFVHYVLSRVEPDASKLLWPPGLRTKQQQQKQQPTRDVLVAAVVVALALRPSLLGSWLAQAATDFLTLH